jgi:hypothetical protein
MKIPELQGIEALKKNVVGVADLAVIRELVKLILGTRRAFFLCCVFSSSAWGSFICKRPDGFTYGSY